MLENLTTESRNEKSVDLDKMTTTQLLELMNEEDSKVAGQVKSQIPKITQAVEVIIQARRNGGRLIYMGAGTSGRIGLLDAVECPPTFGTDPDEVIGLIAGGEKAFIKAVEGAEDDKDLGASDLKAIHFIKEDVLVGIAASGRTPYVIGGIAYANKIGAKTITIACNKDSEIGKLGDIAIEVVLGAEVITGSTRLKAGTAQKLICNMLSSASMVGSGKVYGNLMVDVQLTNEKLRERAKRIIMEATEVSYDIAQDFLKKADDNPKIAIVMILTNLSKAEAILKLEKTQGFISKVIEG